MHRPINNPSFQRTVQGAVHCADYVLHIVSLLQDLSRFNDFFMSAEEDNVIKLQALLDQIQAAAAGNQQEQLHRLMAQLVDFHGERGEQE